MSQTPELDHITRPWHTGEVLLSLLSGPFTGLDGSCRGSLSTGEARKLQVACAPYFRPRSVGLSCINTQTVCSKGGTARVRPSFGLLVSSIRTRHESYKEGGSSDVARTAASIAANLGSKIQIACAWPAIFVERGESVGKASLNLQLISGELREEKQGSLCDFEGCHQAEILCPFHAPHSAISRWLTAGPPGSGSGPSITILALFGSLLYCPPILYLLLLPLLLVHLISISLLEHHY